MVYHVTHSVPRTVGWARRSWLKLLTMASDFGGLGVFLLGLFLLNNYSALSVEAVDVTQHLTYKYETPEGHQAAILDNLFPEETLGMLMTKGFYFAPWHYTDKFEINENDNNIAWQTKMSTEFFVKTHVWNMLEKSLSSIIPSKKLYPYSVTCNILRRFDPITVEKLPADDYIITILLNKHLRKDDYGHISIYIPNGNGSADIVMTSHPRPGRVTVWNGALSHLYHPPSMNYVKCGYLMTIKATTSKEKLIEIIERSEDKQESTVAESGVRNDIDNFPMFPGTIPKYNLDNHLTRKFYDAKHRVVAIYDNVFTKEQLDMLYNYLVSVEDKILFSDTDTDVKEDSDNVQWIKLFSVEGFVRSNIWDIVYQVAQHVSNNRTEWYPYDVSLNVIRNGDHTRIHEDCENFEDEFTFLLYMNPDWEVNNYGETTFFDTVVDDPMYRNVGEGHEQYEAIGAIKPKYGRIAIFQGIIPHSARPPSSRIYNARYTFAVKVSATKRIANAKALREAYEQQETTAGDEHLIWELMTYKHAVHSPGKPDSWLAEELQRQLEKRSLYFKEQIQDAEEFLLKYPDDVNIHTEL